MAVRVRIPSSLRHHAANLDVLVVEGSRVAPVFDALRNRYPGLVDRLFIDGEIGEGRLRRFVNLYLNDQDLRHLDGLATTVEDGDEISIVCAVAGG